MNTAAPKVSRRRWLQLASASAVLLAAGGGAAWLWRPGWQQGRLTPSGREVFGAIARVVLEGSLPSEPAAQAAALTQHLDRLDVTLAGLPRPTQTELSRLLGLLSVAPGRQWLTGLSKPWAQASVGELEAMLRRLRASDNLLKLQAYLALRDLTNAAYYAQTEHWSQLGYPGPSAV